MPIFRIGFSLYLPGWLYVPLRKAKRALIRTNGRLNLRGDRDVEWSFIAAHMPEGPGEALDFGCGTSYLSLIAARRGFRVIALDLEAQAFPWQSPQVRFMQVDLLKMNGISRLFDLVIACSSVEHVGLVGRYDVADELPDGDLQAMRQFQKLMKPGGVLLLTIPVGEDAVFAPLCRVYGPKRLPRLLEGFTVEYEEFWVKDQENRWVICHRQTALDSKADVRSWSPLRNVYALGCFVLRRPA